MPIELTLEEQRLVADFHRLDATEKKELLDYAAFLVKKRNSAATGNTRELENQCRLDARSEERPETAKEPIFTE